MTLSINQKVQLQLACQHIKVSMHKENIWSYGNFKILTIEVFDQSGFECCHL